MGRGGKRKRLWDRKIRNNSDLMRALAVGLPIALAASWLLSTALGALLGLFR